MGTHCGGAFVQVTVSNLLNGNTKACKTCGRANANKARAKYPTRQAAVIQDVINRYKRQAARRHISWALTTEECADLFARCCSYCGRDPSNTQVSLYEELRYSGIDRQDNTMAYIAANAVPCCHWCNRTKSDLRTEDFVEYLRVLQARLATMLDWTTLPDQSNGAYMPCTRYVRTALKGRNAREISIPSLVKTLIREYKRHADTEVEWWLSVEQYSELIVQPCLYCGLHYGTTALVGQSQFQYNGVDRFDSSDHHTDGNCVACCEWCNTSKSNLSISEFYINVQRVLGYYNQP